MAVNKGLGRGLSALFQSTEDDYSKTLGVTDEELKSGVLEIELKDIYANPNQPRKIFDPKALEELSTSIKVNGVIMPIVVNKDADGKYMIIAGERRFRASRLAGKETIPAIVREYTERQIKEISLIENLQREDLNPIEAANAMKQLMEDYSLTQEELSERIGKSRSAIANTLRLLTLDQEVIKLVVSNKLSQGHARALITLPPEEQRKISSRAVAEGLSVREVELAVKNYYNPPELVKKIKKVQNQQEMSVELKDLINRMQQTFCTKVSAIGNDKKGRIYIDYYSPEDLYRFEEFLDMIESYGID